MHLKIKTRGWYPHGSSQLPITLVIGDLEPTHRHTCDKITNAHKIKIVKNKNKELVRHSGEEHSCCNVIPSTPYCAIQTPHITQYTHRLLAPIYIKQLNQL